MKALFNLALSPTCFKVLLVEDNACEAELIEDLLSGISDRQQILLTKVERLSEALLCLNKENFDIILLDLSLPDSQGIETVARIQEYGVNVPIVVLTAQNDEELALRLISVGVQDYLVKRKIDGELLMRSLRYAIERQNSQDALRKSEEKYRSVVENSLIGVAIIAPIVEPVIAENCNWIETNDTLCNFLGYERDELMKKNWLELTHPEEYQSNIEQLSQILAGTGDGYISDKRWLRKDGEIVYTRVSLRCIRRRDGSIDRMIKVVLDVSDRYRYESQLKASEEFLNHTINVIPDPIFVKDDQHRWMILNDASCQLLGKQREELIGKSDYDFFTKAEADFFWARDEEVFKSGIPNEIEEDFTDSQGEKHFISTKKTVFKNPDGSQILVGTIRDVTEYRCQQIALEQSEARFQKLIANLPGAIYQFRLSASGEISFPYVSSGSREIYELEPEVIEENAEMIFSKIHSDDISEVEESIAISAATMQPWQQQWRYVLPSGKVKWLQGASRPEMLNNQAKAGNQSDIIWDGLVMDITELKQAQIERDRFFTISLDLLCIVGFDGYFRRLNPAWSTALGYSSAELFAQPLTDFIHPDDREATTAENQKLINGTPSIYFENRCLCKDGSYKWLLWTASPFSEESLIYAVARDITSRKQAESALQRQAVAMDAAYDGIAILNYQEEYIYLNHAYLKMYDIASPSKLLGKSWKILYSEAEFKQFEKLIISALQTTGHCNIEAIGQRYDGTQFPQEMSMTRLAGGETISIVRDITNRKRAESALLASQQRYQILAEASPVCIFHTDVFGNCLYINGRWNEMTGISSELAVRNGWLNAIHSDDMERVKTEWERAIFNKVSFKSEYRFQRPDGTVSWVIGQAVAEVGDGDQIKGYIGTITDISDRKQAEMALVQQLRRERLVVAMLDRIRSSLNLEEILTTAVEQVRQLLQTDRTVIYRFNPDWSGVVVTESVAKNRLSMRNLNINDPGFTQRFLDIYQQGFVRSIEDIYNADLSECHINLLEQFEVKANLVVPILKSEKNISNPRKTTENRLWGLLIAHDCKGPRSWESSEIESLRQLCMQLAIAIQQSTLFQQAQTEIADRKQAEAALQKAALVAETANRAKSEFLANMSHELRTPLNGVLGYAQILKTDKTLNPDHQESLSNIQQCGQHLLMLIEDVLDLSKIEAMKMELYPTELNILDFIKNIADLFQMRASQKEIIFRYEQVSPLPKCVYVDEKRLRQILINLLSNAVKFTNSGGVTFKVGYVGTEAWKLGQKESCEFSILSSELKQNYLRFSQNEIPDKHTIKIRFQVEDTGTGIDESKLEEIFLPFHQVGSNRFVEGTGLGLSISRKLAKLMGSEIYVKSTLDRGSIFWLDLELPAPKLYSEMPLLQERRWLVGFVGDKRKVLIVDDNQVNRSMLRRLLSGLGFEIAEAENGEECLDKAVEFKPNVILLDLLMPVMDGLETARRVRQLPELKDVVLIALSANVFENTQQESFLAGCDYFMSKPIEANHFLEQLRLHLGLEWIYEDCLEGKKRTTVSLLPKSELPNYSDLLPLVAESVVRLFKLAAMGDIEGIFDEAVQLESLEPKLMLLISRVRQLAKKFGLKQIRTFLKEYIDGK
ncbi:MAG: PAS domain S-box protein [Oscillatoriales cyanobacterium]|nr:MAG: PAS domain S-box protein [Oscillatoriales cyanobacterium]TAH23187.1 MAG: PAS domain S-box protein [Oscillatoriales cyanobacterium]